MKPAISRIAIIVICAVFAGGFANFGDTQQLDGERMGDWTFRCQGLSNNRNVCALTQTLVGTETKQPALRLALRRMGRDNKLVMIVVAPLGTFLGSTVVGKVDDGPRFNFVWQRCTVEWCQASMTVESWLYQALKVGKQLSIGFRTQPNAKMTTLVASLKGVTQGLRALDAK